MSSCSCLLVCIGTKLGYDGFKFFQEFPEIIMISNNLMSHQSKLTYYKLVRIEQVTSDEDFSETSCINFYNEMAAYGIKCI